MVTPLCGLIFPYVSNFPYPRLLICHLPECNNFDTVKKCHMKRNSLCAVYSVIIRLLDVVAAVGLAVISASAPGWDRPTGPCLISVITVGISSLLPYDDDEFAKVDCSGR